LSAYGGFGTTITPQFTAYGTFLLEQGCTLAIANIRGGSEFGVEWHEAAKREKRHNAFDDFFAAAESLIDSGHTTPEMLGIVGGSNAGLLVGVAITQRPELFRAAVCLGPLLDMVRYHRFGNARFWADEYGCADRPEEFVYLYAYSPYHRIRAGEKYPAVLLISGDEDKRCDASHARKMTARLQRATSSELPVLLDYKSCRGHSPVLPLHIRIEGLTDRIAFLCDQLGIHVRKVWRKQG
jgi:prolyl oligopeptidase